MKEYGCCPKFKRGDNSTYTFTKRGGHVPCNRSEVTHSSSYYYICKTVFYCFRYNAVIHACCLQEDMESFISGSETEVHIPTNLIIRQTKETTRFAFDASLLSSQR